MNTEVCTHVAGGCMVLRFVEPATANEPHGTHLTAQNRLAHQREKKPRYTGAKWYDVESKNWCNQRQPSTRRRRRHGFCPRGRGVRKKISFTWEIEYGELRNPIYNPNPNTQNQKNIKQNIPDKVVWKTGTETRVDCRSSPNNTQQHHPTDGCYSAALSGWRYSRHGGCLKRPIPKRGAPQTGGNLEPSTWRYVRPRH